MQSEAAILWEVGSNWSVEPIELDPPGLHEVLVELRAAGLCHTDDHFVTGDMAWPLPTIGGHEGAGVVTATGPGVEHVAVGDHVVLNYMPMCGTCPSCTSGRSRLCDRGSAMGKGLQINDGTSRHHARGKDLTLVCGLGTFARHTVVHEDSCVVVGADVPFDVGALLSCGAVTGWGSAVRAGEVGPGTSVAVVGVGGLGSAAVQGARMVGARHVIAIDPVEFKRDNAIAFGATHTARTMTDAFDLVHDLTGGRMCEAVILTMGVGDGAQIADAMALTGKSGAVVVANAHPQQETTVNLSLADLTIMEKRLVGSVFGGCNARTDIPMLIELYRTGQLELDRLITRRYPLGDVNQGYADLHAGINIRGVLDLTA
jgi:S-(hydroxymethyl)glutathione dehydrogenase/alcohol dehydrogenase